MDCIVLKMLYLFRTKTVHTLPKALDLSYLHVKCQKFGQKLTSRWSKTDFLGKKSKNEVIMASNDVILKCRRAIERGVQYDSFDMPIQNVSTVHVE